MFKLSIFPSVPQVPTGFDITEEYPTVTDITLTYEWDSPQGMGPEVIVDYYLITISPQPLSHSNTSVVSSSPWNVTVDYNVTYIASITAVNCAGQSGTLELMGIEYGMCSKQNTVTVQLS